MHGVLLCEGVTRHCVSATFSISKFSKLEVSYFAVSMCDCGATSLASPMLYRGGKLRHAICCDTLPLICIETGIVQ
jgi:hypothetical protein